MPAYTAILRRLSPTRFEEIFAASARQARQTYLARHNIRAPRPRGLAAGVSHNNRARVAALFARLATCDDEEMAEQILRAWLLRRRPLLAATLDALQIAHDDGLTASDEVHKIAALAEPEVVALIDVLQQKQVAPLEEMAIYLAYMGVEGIDAVISAKMRE